MALVLSLWNSYEIPKTHDEFMTERKSFVFRFGDVEVREREFTLIKAGEVLPVEPKILRVLLFLLHNPQRLITKEELLNAVWGDTAVTESSLTRIIALLRRLLGDDFREPRYIETVPTVGYRFVCNVEIFEDSPRSPEVASKGNGSEESDSVEGRANSGPSGAAENGWGLDQEDRYIRPNVEKSPAGECASASNGNGNLEESHALAFEPFYGINLRAFFRQSRQPRLAIPILIILLALGSLSSWWLHRRSLAQLARNQTIPEIGRLADNDEFVKAAALAREARAVLPSDPMLDKLWLEATGEVSIASEPSGADVSFRPYRGDPNVWETLSKTPLKRIRVPREQYVWRVVKPGFAPMFFIDDPSGVQQPGSGSETNWTLRLRPEGSVPPEMLAVSGGVIELGFPTQEAPQVEVGDFLIDRHEVTNQEYKKFVDAGGYRKREFWKQPFLKDGKAIPWAEAMAYFRDSTGDPGPATWEVGSYPNGMEQHPVAGVSWYEAAAYAEFAGKSLPTVYHWTQASQSGDFTPLISSGSNFQGRGTRPVGSSSALSGFGTTDMAGNVKEWCLNEGRGGRRFILGGGFGEPEYMSNFTDEQSPWDRRSNFGFRCVKLDSPPTPAVAGHIEVATRDFSKDKPVPTDVFKAYLTQFSYDKGELNARVEETTTTSEWTREKVSFDAAYGHERVIAYLYLPRNVSPPFQLVMYYPGGLAYLADKLDLPAAESTDPLEFLLKSGRALMFPIYKGTYVRRDGFLPGDSRPAVVRDHRIAFSKDLGRSLDYLDTRKDIDTTKVAYFGFSAGGREGPMLASAEKRIRVMIVSSGGLPFSYDPPEVDAFNFLPHVTIPVLMLNGRYDQDFPLESSQLPYFRSLGTPAQDKKHVVYEGGHGVFPHPDAVRESLNWLDKYLGPVQK